MRTYRTLIPFVTLTLALAANAAPAGYSSDGHRKSNTLRPVAVRNIDPLDGSQILAEDDHDHELFRRVAQTQKSANSHPSHPNAEVPSKPTSSSCRIAPPPSGHPGAKLAHRELQPRIIVAVGAGAVTNHLSSSHHSCSSPPHPNLREHWDDPPPSPRPETPPPSYGEAAGHLSHEAPPSSSTKEDEKEKKEKKEKQSRPPPQKESFPYVQSAYKKPSLGQKLSEHPKTVTAVGSVIGVGSIVAIVAPLVSHGIKHDDDKYDRDGQDLNNDAAGTNNGAAGTNNGAAGTNNDATSANTDDAAGTSNAAVNGTSN